jgi:hypothetical protein
MIRSTAFLDCHHPYLGQQPPFLEASNLLLHPKFFDGQKLLHFFLTYSEVINQQQQHLQLNTSAIMSNRYYQLQAEGSYSHSSRSSSPRPHRPQPQTNPNYSSRTSTFSDSSSSSSASSSYYNDSSSQQSISRVETLRCSRCAKCVETVVATARGGNRELGRVSSADASASGMVRFGHNLYYCERCARMVGYK